LNFPLTECERGSKRIKGVRSLFWVFLEGELCFRGTIVLRCSWSIYHRQRVCLW